MTYNPDFDIDLSFGKQIEDDTLSLLMGTAEVKAERDHWQRTGNIAVEVYYKGRPSGVSSTKAKWWIHVLTVNELPVMWIILSVNDMRKLCKRYWHNQVMGGDSNQSQLVLIPLKEVFNLWIG